MLASVVACDETFVAACTAGSISVASVTGQPAVPATADVTVHVTLVRPAGVTIYNALVAGVSATSTSDNYTHFDAVIPIAVLQSLAPSGGVAMAPITLVTNCATEPTLDPALVPVAPRALASLSVDVGSAGSGYLPATLAVQTAVTVYGAGSGSGSDAGSAAAGAQVVVETTFGQLEGSASVTLTLDNSGTALTALSPDPSGRSGVAVIHARTATIAAAPKTVTFIGPPILVPSSGAISSGDTVQILLDPHGGTLAACTAVGTADVTVTATLSGSGSDACAGSASVDLAHGGDFPASQTACTWNLALVVAVAGSGVKESVTVSCEDIYHQVGSAAFASP
jgi:hypothetical protein